MYSTVASSGWARRKYRPSVIRLLRKTTNVTASHASSDRVIPGLKRTGRQGLVKMLSPEASTTEHGGWIGKISPKALATVQPRASSNQRRRIRCFCGL